MEASTDEDEEDDEDYEPDNEENWKKVSRKRDLTDDLGQWRSFIQV